MHYNSALFFSRFQEDRSPNQDHSVTTGDINDVLVLIRSFDDGNNDSESKITDRISFSWQSSPPQEVSLVLWLSD